VLVDQLLSATWEGTRAAGRSARGTPRRASERHPKLLFHSRRHIDWPDLSPTPRWERAVAGRRACGEPCGGDRYLPRNRDDARDGISNQRLDMGQHQSLSISLSIRDDSEQLRTFHFNAEQNLGPFGTNRSEMPLRCARLCARWQKGMYIQLNCRNGQLGTIGSSSCRFVPSWNDLEQFRTNP
jgi:hypothetical protein